MCLLHRFVGASRQRPHDLKDKLSVPATDLVKRVYERIDPALLTDYHTHVAGVGTSGAQVFVNPQMHSWAHPKQRFKLAAYLSAFGVRDAARTDQQVTERLADLVRHNEWHGKHRILAFDQHYTRDGAVNIAKTQFYVSNEYVFNLAAQHPDLFEPVISVHPYRTDALAELTKWAGRGGRLVKWLPNAMGIDPSDELCDPFYQKMRELNLVLLCHGGEEKAVEAEEDQKLGNPLLLRRPLEQGLKVIVAHCAGLGDNEDIEAKERPRRPNFEFFLRLMDEKKYQGFVFGDIAAMTQFNRIGHLKTVVQRDDLHQSLVNGSDYPLPAINILIRTKTLARAGFITPEERGWLNEIYDFNPLLFDFVLKRCLVRPGTSKHLPVSVFHRNRILETV